MDIAAAPKAAAVAMTTDERIEQLKSELEETKDLKASLERLLLEKPFMNLQIRQKYKRAIPSYEAKIKRLRLDIAAANMLREGPIIDDGRPINLPRHYQNYPSQKKPPGQQN